MTFQNRGDEDERVQSSESGGAQHEQVIPRNHSNPLTLVPSLLPAVGSGYGLSDSNIAGFGSVAEEPANAGNHYPPSSTALHDPFQWDAGHWANLNAYGSSSMRETQPSMPMSTMNSDANNFSIWESSFPNVLQSPTDYGASSYTQLLPSASTTSPYQDSSYPTSTFQADANIAQFPYQMIPETDQIQGDQNNEANALVAQLPVGPLGIVDDNPATSASKRKRKRVKAAPQPSTTKKTVATRKRLAKSNKQEPAPAMREPSNCLRCRVYKEDCDENTPCSTCIRKLKKGGRIWKQPCYRGWLGNVVAFRLSNSDLGQVRATYPELAWSAEDTKIHKVVFGYAFPRSYDTPKFVLDCRMFKPTPKQRFDTSSMTDIVGKFLIECQPIFQENILTWETDEILRLTYAEAIRFATKHESQAVRQALRVKSFASQQIDLLDTALGIEVIHDPNFFFPGYRPLPMYLMYQCDLTINLVIDVAKQDAMEQLNSMIFYQDRFKCWFEVFLCVFLVLWTIENAYLWQVKHQGQLLETQRFASMSFVTRLMLEEWDNSAENLLEHFRAVIRGHLPFSDDGGKMVDLAELDPESSEYVNRIRNLMQRRPGT
ncbi:hypothetical protein GT037_004315 [Alternaria burnsii]|uniref:Zn(2)-C6 fungal-type domain-containing protein n=1 Tax=Alternaria burnsii TaxID=1187904 RepID=A0A8H7EGX4_9PLEO|nr:uncharacterized protein GT037_004315 [Alternaria burnsii]KAF7677456.1 hypothetical protein GT037_004315 [Alternaria burnsii]